MLLSGGEKAVTGKRECTDDEHAYQPHHGSDKDRHYFCESLSTHDRARRHMRVIRNCDRHTPPSEGGVETCGQQPGAEEKVHFGRFITALFRGKDAGDTGKVNAAECDGKDGCPAKACEGEVAEHIPQGELRGAEVEDLEREQGTDDHQSPGCAAVELSVADQVIPNHPQAISDVTTICCCSHFDLLFE